MKEAARILFFVLIIAHPLSVHTAFSKTPGKTRFNTRVLAVAVTLTVHQKGPVTEDERDQRDNDKPLP